MLSTSLAAVVLSGVMLSAAPAQPTWETDYRKALAQVSSVHKPLAVFITHGSSPAKLIATDRLPAAATQTLAASYVCLMVDADTDAGKALAATFELNEGLVISDSTGAKQALRHVGSIGTEELATTLVKFAEPTRVVTTTETNAVATAAPMNVAPVRNYSPVPTFGQAPAFLQPGGCPNGRCPNAR